MSLGCPDMAADAINRLREKGLEPTLDHIATLIELARRIQEPETKTYTWMSYVGVQVGVSRRRFRPVTIKSGMWFDWVINNISDPALITFATGMAMEYGHDKDYDFSKLYTIESAIDAIREYAERLDVNEFELSDAIERCTDETLHGDTLLAERREASKSIDIEDTIAYLVAATGQPAEVWMSSTFDYALKVCSHSAAIKAMSSGLFEADKDDAEMRNNFMFMAELQKIESELQGQVDGED